MQSQYGAYCRQPSGSLSGAGRHSKSTSFCFYDLILLAPMADLALLPARLRNSLFICTTSRQQPAALPCIILHRTHTIPTHSSTAPGVQSTTSSPHPQAVHLEYTREEESGISSGGRATLPTSKERFDAAASAYLKLLLGSNLQGPTHDVSSSPCSLDG